jgi:hypothetical protein
MSSYALVSKAALQLVRNALRRDIEEGKRIRLEILLELDAETFDAPVTRALTDEQILAIMNDYPVRTNDWSDHINFARAILTTEVPDGLGA